MPQVFKMIAVLVVSTVGEGLAAGATPFSLRFDPTTSFASAVVGGHNFRIGGEKFLDEHWSVGTCVTYTQLLMSNINRFSSRFVADQKSVESAEAAKHVTLDASYARAVSLLLSRYHGPDDRLYGTVGLGLLQSDVAAHEGDGSRRVLRRELVPEFGYGYQWRYRHGGFVSVGGATAYRVPLAESVQVRGDGDSQNLSDATSGGARLYPELRIGVGAIFR